MPSSAPLGCIRIAGSAAAVASPASWPGLNAWRGAPPNGLRAWGPAGPCLPPASPSSSAEAAAVDAGASLAMIGSMVLSTPEPASKSRLTHLAFERFCRGALPVGVAAAPDAPARLPKPHLVAPREVPSHKAVGVPLNVYMLHNLAHVELNAIDLAWDTVVRFSPLEDELGVGFFADFVRVADDESRHFSWCSQRLGELGFSYGFMPAHNLLWRECAKSSHDVSARLALIPLVQEARGLDAGPRLVQKLIGFGDRRSSDIVGEIAKEEVAHVAVGVHWFLKICNKLGRTPTLTFKDLLKEYDIELKGPYNNSARDEAGIPREWYAGDAEHKFKTDLCQVHDRLEFVVAMEKEVSHLNNQESVR